MKRVNRILLILFIIMLPITVVSLGANITARMPDVYQFDFKATNGLSGLYLEKSDDEMGEFISDFMFGKVEAFQLEVGDDDEKELVFTAEESTAVAKARTYLNVLMVVGLVAMVIAVAAVIMAKRYGLDKELRGYFKKSVSVYAVITVAYVVVFFVILNMGHSPGEIVGYVPMEDEVLPLIFTKGLLTKICLTSAVVGSVLYGLIGYLIYKLTEPKKIFSRIY